MSDISKNQASTTLEGFMKTLWFNYQLHVTACDTWELCYCFLYLLNSSNPEANTLWRSTRRHTVKETQPTKRFV